MVSHGYIVPIAVFAMVLGIIIVVNFANYHLRKLRSRERLAAIEKGLPVSEEYSPGDFPDPRKSAAKTRLTAIILISAGVGTALAFASLAWILHEREVLSAAAFAVIPLAIGIGMLIDYRLQSRALEPVQSENTLNRLSA